MQKRKLAVGVVVTMTMMVLQVLQSMRCQNRFFPTIGTPLLTSPTLLKQGHWKQQNRSFDEGCYDSWELSTYHSTPMWYVVLSIVPLVPYDFKGVCHYTLYPIWGCHILQSLGSFSTGLATFWSVSSTSTELIVFFDFFLHGRNCWSLRLSFWPNTCCIKGKCLEHQRCKASYNPGRSIWTPGSQEQTLRPLLFSRSTQQFAGGCSVQVKQVVFPVVCFSCCLLSFELEGVFGVLVFLESPGLGHPNSTKVWLWSQLQDWPCLWHFPALQKASELLLASTFLLVILWWGWLVKRNRWLFEDKNCF